MPFWGQAASKSVESSFTGFRSFGCCPFYFFVRGTLRLLTEDLVHLRANWQVGRGACCCACLAKVCRALVAGMAGYSARSRRVALVAGVAGYSAGSRRVERSLRTQLLKASSTSGFDINLGIEVAQSFYCNLGTRIAVFVEERLPKTHEVSVLDVANCLTAIWLM